VDPKERRRHLHASVSAASAYGLAVGLWLGTRGQHAGWFEWAVFTAALMIAPTVGASLIDRKYNYTE